MVVFIFLLVDHLCFGGEGNRSSIIKGLDSGPLDHISLSLHFYKIRYEILKSQLGSIVKDNQFNYNRYFHWQKSYI